MLSPIKHHYSPVLDDETEDEDKYDQYDLPNTQLDKANMIYHHNGIEDNADSGKGSEYDYIRCNEQHIAQCKPMQRIISVLQFYKAQQKVNPDAIYAEITVAIYEYMSLRIKYNASTFMQDWYHCKSAHFKEEKDREWLQSKEEINCNDKNQNKTCIYIDRYQRTRGNEHDKIGVEIDYKNMIIRDQIDSIHAFIFHSSTTRYDDQNVYKVQSLSYDYDAKQDEYKSLIIIELVQNIDTLNDNTLNKNKNKIIQYFEENNIDFDKFANIERKEFLNSVANYCNDKKVRGRLPKVLKFKTKTITNKEPEKQDYVSNPMLLKLTSTIDKINKPILTKNKAKFMKYFEENHIDIAKLRKMNRKQFGQSMVNYCNEKKLKAFSVKLYTLITKNDQENISPKHVKSSKFMTASGDQSKTSYYSFGEQYRYTHNLTKHPLFIKPKYTSVKEDLYQFFLRENIVKDKQMLLDSQIDTLQSLLPQNPEFQSIVTKLSRNPNELVSHDNKHLTCLLFDLNDIPTQLKDDLIILENLNSLKVIQVVEQLFDYLPREQYDKLKLFSEHIFVALLDGTLNQTNFRIKNNVIKYVKKMNMNQLRNLINKVHELSLIVTGNKKQEKLASGKFSEIMKHYYKEIFVGGLEKYLTIKQKQTIFSSKIESEIILQLTVDDENKFLLNCSRENLEDTLTRKIQVDTVKNYDNYNYTTKNGIIFNQHTLNNVSKEIAKFCQDESNKHFKQIRYTFNEHTLNNVSKQIAKFYQDEKNKHFKQIVSAFLKDTKVYTSLYIAKRDGTVFDADTLKYINDKIKKYYG
eukprot:418726_1